MWCHQVECVLNLCMTLFCFLTHTYAFCWNSAARWRRQRSPWVVKIAEHTQREMCVVDNFARLFHHHYFHALMFCLCAYRVYIIYLPIHSSGWMCYTEHTHTHHTLIQKSYQTQWNYSNRYSLCSVPLGNGCQPTKEVILMILNGSELAKTLIVHGKPTIRECLQNTIDI